MNRSKSLYHRRFPKEPSRIVTFAEFDILFIMLNGLYPLTARDKIKSASSDYDNICIAVTFRNKHMNDHECWLPRASAGYMVITAAILLSDERASSRAVGHVGRMRSYLITSKLTFHP